MSVFKDKRWVCDLESNGLLWDASCIWCLACICINEPDTRLFFGPDEVSEALVDLFRNASLTVWHNGIAYDCPLVERLLGIKVDRSKVRDTLVMSRLANSAREVPPSHDISFVVSLCIFKGMPHKSINPCVS